MGNLMPESSKFAFVPACTVPSLPQEIRLVFEGELGYFRTSMRAPDLGEAAALCRRLNAVAGVDTEEAARLTAQSMRSLK